MERSSLYQRAGWFLLGMTVLLWALAALFLLRIANIFDRILMEFPGPSTSPESFEIRLSIAHSQAQTYLQGNIGPHRPDRDVEEWRVIRLADAEAVSNIQALRAASAFPTNSIETSSAERALASVLAGAGATAPSRDAVDRRVIHEVQARTGAIIDNPEQGAGIRICSPVPLLKTRTTMGCPTTGSERWAWILRMPPMLERTQTGMDIRIWRHGCTSWQGMADPGLSAIFDAG